MKSKLFATAAAVLAAMTTLVALLCLMGQGNSPALHRALAAPQQAPTVTAVDLASAPNDLDTPIVITGTGFTAGMTMTLGSMRLPDATWVSSTMLTATVPWGLDPGVYAVTVTNPDGQSGSKPNAFTVTQGLGVWTSGGPYGGRVTRLAITSTTTTLLYALIGDAVGIFRSQDGGENWKMVRADIYYMEMDPLSPNTLYAAPNEEMVYRSDDGGDTWVDLPIGYGGRIRIFPHPGISGTVYVGVSQWTPTSLQGGHLLKSENRGSTWTDWTNGLTDTQVTAVAFDPTNSQTIYVGTYSGAVFRSVNGGLSWESIGQTGQRVERLIVNPFIPTELWACREAGGGGIVQTRGLWKYDSISWTQVLTDGVFTCALSQRVSGTLWAGRRGSVSKSTDGGQTWTQFAGGIPGGVAALAVDPADERIVYMGRGGGGVYKTTDDGVTSHPVNNSLAGVVPKSLAPMPGNPSTVYAVHDSFGIFKTNNSGDSWVKLPNDTQWSMAVSVDPITPTRVYLVLGEDMDISEDGGYTWHRVTLSPPPQYQGHTVEPQALLVNPGLAGHLVIGVSFVPSGTGPLASGGVYTSTDYGETWTYVDVGRPISAVAALAYDPASPTVIYAGTDRWGSSGKGAAVLKSMDRGNTWQYHRNGLENWYGVTSLAVEPSAPHRVFAASSGSSGGGSNLAVSTDGGQTWSPAPSPPDADAPLLAFGPGNPPVLYDGTSKGLYRTWDSGQSWQKAEGALGSARIYSLAVVTNTGRTVVYAATAGGLLTTTTSLMRSLAASNETLLAPGMYRYTTRVVGLQNGSLNGPAAGTVRRAYTFTATVNPITATPPFWYEWQATGQLPLTRTTGSQNDIVTFTWPSPGAQVITVTMMNAEGAISLTHAIAIISVPPSGVALSGPTTGLANRAYLFSATVSPVSATTPFTYMWQATGQSPVTHTGELNDTTSFVWPLGAPGAKTITVTAASSEGAVTATHVITVSDPPSVWLPGALNLNLGPTDPTLDPALDAGGPSRFVVNQLFLGLTRVKDETGEVIPELATSWETSADATVFTFTLRNDIRWTNGQTVTAYDVHYGILRSLDPATGAPMAATLYMIQNAQEYNEGTLTDPNLVGVMALDDTHLHFTLKQAAAYLPHILALPVARPIPQAALEAHGVPTWTYPANMVSNGAYSLTAWTHGVSMTLRRNPGYYDAANVQIERVTLNMVDDTTAWNLYQAGQLDSVLVSQTEWITATRSVTLARELHVASMQNTYYYGFNTAKAPFTSTLVRQAFIAAVDRQGVIDHATGYAEQPALTFTAPGMWGHVDGLTEGVGIPYSPTLAQQWLAAAGYPNGQGLPTVTLMYSTTALHQAVAEYIRQNWMDSLSVTVVLSGVNRNTFNNLLRTNPPQLWRQGWSFDQYDAYNFLYEGIFSTVGGRAKYGNWNNPTYDALLNQAAQTTDPNTRKALYKQAEEILVETDAIMLPIYYWGNGIASKSYLQRTYGEGGWGGRIANWRITRQVFLPLVLKN